MTNQSKPLVIIIAILALVIVFLGFRLTSSNNPANNNQSQTAQTPVNQTVPPVQQNTQTPANSGNNSSNNPATINPMLGIDNRLNINMEQEPDFETRTRTSEEVRNFIKAHFDTLYDYELEKTNPLHPDLIKIQEISSTGKQKLGEWFVQRASELSQVGDISNANFMVAYTKRSDGSTYVYGVVVYWGNGLGYQIDKWLVEVKR